MALSVGCSCDRGGDNLNLPNCSELFGITTGFVLQGIVADDGTANRIDLDVASIGTAFSDLLVDPDKSKRTFPITDIRNVDFPKEDVQYETDSAGQKEETRDGIQSVTAEKWKVPPGYDLKLKSHKCNRQGTFNISKEGVEGIRRLDPSDGKMYWYPIEITAFAPNYMKRTATTRAKEMILFDYNSSVNLGELWMLTWEDLGMTIEDMVGLFDANLTEEIAPSAAASVTTIEFVLTSDYGTGVTNNTIIDGQLTADFSVKNGAGVDVAALAVVEVAGVKYTATYTQETPGDNMTASMVLASGYEGTYEYVEPA